MAIVTGAGRGIGRAMTLGLAQAGIRVVATSARERAEIDAVAAEAGANLVVPVLADVIRETDAQRVVSAALESEAAIWAQHLRGTGMTVNAMLPGGATLTGVIPDVFPESARGRLLDPSIMVPPLLWLVSSAADTISGCRVIANQWDEGNPLAATKSAGWGGEATGQPAT